MKPVSDAFLRSMSGSHPFLTRATVCSSFQTGTSPTGVPVSVIDGSVTFDATAATWGTADVTVDGTRSWPISTDSPLAPYGNELYLERGIQFSDALVEYVKLGYFRIQGPDQDGLSNSPIRLALVDRMQAIIDARLLAPRQFQTGVTLGSIVTSLVTEIYPAATIQWDDTSDQLVTTRSIICEEDRYGFLNDLITSRGKVWYWDGRGILVIKTPPSATNVVYDVFHGVNGVLATFARSLSRNDTFNAVVASGEGGDTNTPVRGVAIDGNPGSPTYFYGRFGQVPMFYSSPFLTTNAQCTDAAEQLLNRQLGLPYTISFGTIVNPALEPYDAISIKYSHDEAEQTHVLDTVTVPLLGGDVLTAKTRVQRVTLAQAI